MESSNSTRCRLSGNEEEDEEEEEEDEEARRNPRS